jgi:hypothetical protein
MAKTMKPGQKAPRSGEYEIIGARGRNTREGSTVVRGEPLPPTSKPGHSHMLRTKSGRFIISSPAKSANTRYSWSRAFKSK